MSSQSPLYYLGTCAQRMKQAEGNLSAFCQAVSDTHANWQGFVATDPSPTFHQEAGQQFAVDCQALIDARKDDLRAALDVLAAGAGITPEDIRDLLYPASE